MYEGPLRSGSFGDSNCSGKVRRCYGCGVDRLEENNCTPVHSYESDQYRKNMNQGLEISDFFLHADPVQIHNLSAFWHVDFRNKIVADVGCGGGSFLNHISGLASKIIAIEPTERYHDSLRTNGYQVFSFASDAAKKHPETVDIVVTFQVIEHVLNPLEFLVDIISMLKPGGILIIATPNRDDILLKLLPEHFQSFFYRNAHRWYFNQASLRYCAEKAGLIIKSERYSQTYGLSNTLSWLKDLQPKGFNRLQGIDIAADNLWKSYLESTGQSDNIFILAQKQ